VNDTMLMGQPSAWEEKSIKQLLCYFMDVSNTYINQEKYPLFLFNIDPTI